MWNSLISLTHLPTCNRPGHNVAEINCHCSCPCLLFSVYVQYVCQCSASSAPILLDILPILPLGQAALGVIFHVLTKQRGRFVPSLFGNACWQGCGRSLVRGMTATMLSINRRLRRCELSRNLKSKRQGPTHSAVAAHAV